MLGLLYVCISVYVLLDVCLYLYLYVCLSISVVYYKATELYAGLQYCDIIQQQKELK